MPFGSTGKINAAMKWTNAGKDPLSNKFGPSKRSGPGFIGKALGKGVGKVTSAIGNNVRNSASALVNGRKLKIKKPSRIAGMFQTAKDKVGDQVSKGAPKLGIRDAHKRKFNLSNDDHQQLRRSWNFQKKAPRASHRKRFNLGKDEQKQLRSKFAHLKIAKISTPQERAKMKAYRMANKAKIRLAARKRRMKVRTGAHRKKKRIGSASAGYTFIMDPKAGPSFGGKSVSQSIGKLPGSNIDFNPEKRTGSTHSPTHLRPL